MRPGLIWQTYSRRHPPVPPAAAMWDGSQAHPPGHIWQWGQSWRLTPQAATAHPRGAVLAWGKGSLRTWWEGRQGRCPGPSCVGRAQREDIIRTCQSGGRNIKSSTLQQSRRGVWNETFPRFSFLSRFLISNHDLRTFSKICGNAGTNEWIIVKI